MNALKYLFTIALLITVVVSCKKDNFGETSFLATATAPDKLSALFDITQDNTGKVTITPNGEGASTFDIYYGDANKTPAVVTPGKNTQHIYAEGVYDVRIVAHSITGQITEATQKLTVSFRAPENLVVTTAFDNANIYKLNVSAKALYETLFKVYFGDVPNETPISFLEGEIISHIYKLPGTYTVRVVALSGGAATTEISKQITIVDPVLLPVTFESATLNYAFSNFAGGEVTVINNPQVSGINTSTKVARMVKKAGEVYGGSVLALGGSMDFSTNKIFRMKVYSPRVGAKVLLKVENAADNTKNFEKEVATTVANAWEDMVFDYRTINTANTYQRVVLIFDLGTMGDGSANFTYLFDDIRLTNTIPSNLLSLPVTFDDAGVNYSLTDFEGNVSVLTTDPTNATNKVAMSTKPVGAQPWAGTTIGTNAGFASAIPLAPGSTRMSLRVYSPAAGLTVRLKVEDHTNPTKSVETDAVTTAANTWETLTFDFANQGSGTAAINYSYTYDKASVFFDFLKPATGKVFYWDDVKMAATPPPSSVLSLPLDFESATLKYAFTDFNGGAVTIINNAQMSGINTSSKVAKMVKGVGEVYGGSFITLASPIDFSTKKTFKMKVFSPRVGAKVLLKVENLTNGGISYEKEVATTKANAWEEITFDYSGINTANAYQKIVLIFDLGTVGDGSANFTYLFDDISLN